MTIIDVFAKQKYEKEVFRDKVDFQVHLSKLKDYIDTTPLKSRSTLAFFESLFMQGFTITRIDDIDETEIDAKSDALFKLIDISFFNCRFDNHKLEKVKCYGIEIGLYNSYCRHFLIRDCDLSRISVNNSFGTFFLINNIKKVYLSYKYENLSLLLINKDFSPAKTKLPEIKTSFHLINIYQLDYDTNEEYSGNEEKKLEALKYLKKIDISLHLVYDQSFQMLHAKIMRSRFSSIELNGIPSGKIHFESNEVNQLYIKKFISIGEFSLIGLKPIGKNSIFEITASSLRNAWFDYINFKDFDKINIYGSLIETIKFSRTKFPDKKNKITALSNVHQPNIKVEDYAAAVHENYRQLYQAVVKQGDIRETLEMRRMMFESKRKTKDLKLEDRLILWLNWISNNHRVSIARPLLLWAIFILIFTFIHLWTSIELPFEWGYEGWKSYRGAVAEGFQSFGRNYKYALVLANPAHRLVDLTKDGEISNLNINAYWISFLSRIIVAYFYYQFVAAFRKFAK